MSLSVIRRRAIQESRGHDHVAWFGKCSKCGIARNVLAEDMKKDYGDCDLDLREVDVKCRSPRCKGFITNMMRMSEERALHLCDITRRK